MLIIMIIIDGCNEYYIDEDNTPFLHSLSKSGHYIPMDTSPSFAANTELFTGRLPGTSDTFVDFCQGASILPFQLFKILKASKKTSIPSWSILKPFYFLYFLLTGVWVAAPNIPFPLIPYFNVNKTLMKDRKAQKKCQGDNLAAILKSNGYKMNIVYGGVEKIDKKLKNLNLIGRDVLMVHYSETDDIGHEYGPNSEQMKKVLGKIDASIKNTYELLKPKTDLTMIFGDHNMAEVTITFDLWGALQKLDVSFIKDYLVFLNSPMARFWFKNKKAEEEIRTLLRSLHSYGREVTKDEMRQKGLPIDDKYGELIFWAKKGVNFSPDFYHSNDIKGMHGYFDDEDPTPLIICGKGHLSVEKKTCTFQDIAPTVLDFLNLQLTQTDGESLLIKD